MVLLARVHVDFHPLNGTWNGHHWDRQEARCSNNFMAGPNPPRPPAGVRAIRWQIESPEASAIAFNVSVDLPGDDPILFPGLTNEVETTYLKVPPVNAYGKDGTPMYQEQSWPYDEHPWAEYYQRGIYIASVSGASRSFSIDVLGV